MSGCVAWRTLVNMNAPMVGEVDASLVTACEANLAASVPPRYRFSGTGLRRLFAASRVSDTAGAGREQPGPKHRLRTVLRRASRFGRVNRAERACRECREE